MGNIILPQVHILNEIDDSTNLIVEQNGEINRYPISDLDIGKLPKAGFIYPLAASVVPQGFLLCDGAEYFRTAYPELFAAIGTMYGEGDGVNTFNVPNLQTRVPVGKGGDYALGDTGGEETHNHNYGIQYGAYYRDISLESNTNAGILTYNSDGTIAIATPTKVDSYTASVNSSAANSAAEKSMSHYRSVGTTSISNNMQPYTVVNYIIATGENTSVDVEDVITGIQALPLGIEYGGTNATNSEMAKRNLKIKGNSVNLLDNSDFTNMVNQKGASSYTGNVQAYDRWRISRMTVSATKDGLSVVPDSQTGLRYLYQRITKNLSGKKVTVAIDGIPAGGYIKITDYQMKNFISASEPTQSGLNILSAEIPTGNDDGIAVVFYIPDDSSSIFKWAALYEEEYIVDTLPEYYSKGYETELLICRQYDINTGEYIGLRKFSQPANLLDNSNFTNAVDQRSKTSGNELSPVYNTDSTYCIDRWIMRGTGMVYSNETGIRITKKGFSGITQPIDDVNIARLAGKTVTFAAMVKDATGSYEMMLHSGTRAVYIGTSYGLTTFSGTGLKLITVTLPNKFPNSYLGCFIGQGNKGANGDELVIEWCALYEGAYTAETLPEYQPKGYGAELAECQRYYIKFAGQIEMFGDCSSANNINCALYLPNEMRAQPSVVKLPSVVVVRGSGKGYSDTDISLTAFSVSNMNGNFLRCSSTWNQSLAVRYVYGVVLTGLELSADIK